jgi:hypothetical protein
MPDPETKTKKTAKKPLICSICGEKITPELLTGWAGGHNAEPVSAGRCCLACNELYVLPARLRRVYGIEPNAT